MKNAYAFLVCAHDGENVKYNQNPIINMPRYRVTTKSRMQSNGIRIEPGMSVDVVTPFVGNPLHYNGGQAVAEAFMRVYGIDLKRAGALSSIYLGVEEM